MSNSAPVLPGELETGIFIPIKCGATWAPGSPCRGPRGQRSWEPWLLGPGRWASSAALVRGPGSCPHFLPFLAPAVGAGGRGGERKGREGPGAWRGGNGGVRKSQGGDSVQGLGWGPETDGNSGPGPALLPPFPSRSEPEHPVTLPVPILVSPHPQNAPETPIFHSCVAPAPRTPIRSPRHPPASLPSLIPRAHLTLHLPPLRFSPGAPMARPR